MLQNYMIHIFMWILNYINSMSLSNYSKEIEDLLRVLFSFLIYLSNLLLGVVMLIPVGKDKW